MAINSEIYERERGVFTGQLPALMMEICIAAKEAAFTICLLKNTAMKKFLYVVVICIISLRSNAQSLFVPQSPLKWRAQQSTPDSKTIKKEIKELEYSKRKIEVNRAVTAKKRDSAKMYDFDAAEIHTLDSFSHCINNLKMRLDSADKALTKELTEFIATLNKTVPRLTISGIGGISELQKPTQSGGNFSAQSIFRLGKYKRIKASKWADPMFLYISFNTRTGSSGDSAKLTKLFLFPNISKRDFVIGMYWQFRHLESALCIEPIVECSLNRYNGVSDSTAYEFGSESALLGVRFSKMQQFGDTSFEAGFVLFPYYSIINVQPKNYEAYSTLLNGKLPYTVHTLGLQAVLQLSKVQLFADMKYVLNRNSSHLTVDDFRGFTYTIGTMVGVDVLRFR